MTTLLDQGEQSKLMQQIAALIHEKTFTAEAIEGIKLLHEECKKLEANAFIQAERIDTLERDKKAFMLAYDKAQVELKEFRDREGNLVNREARVTELEKTTAVASGKLEAFSDAFHTIFKNTVVRESITGSIPVATGDPPYPTAQPSSEFRTRERE